MSETRNYFNESRTNHTIKKALKRHSLDISAELVNDLQQILTQAKDLMYHINIEDYALKRDVQDSYTRILSEIKVNIDNLNIESLKSDIRNLLQTIREFPSNDHITELEKHFIPKREDKHYVKNEIYSSRVKDINDKHLLLKSLVENSYIDKITFNQYEQEKKSKIKNLTNLLQITLTAVTETQTSVKDLTPVVTNLKASIENENYKHSLLTNAEQFISNQKVALKEEFDLIAKGLKNDFEKEKALFKKEFELVAKRFQDEKMTFQKELNHEIETKGGNKTEKTNKSQEKTLNEFTQPILKTDTFDMSAAGSTQDEIIVPAPKSNGEDSMNELTTDPPYASADAKRIFEEYLKESRLSFENRMNALEESDPLIKKIRDKQRKKEALTDEERVYLFRKS